MTLDQYLRDQGLSLTAFAASIGRKPSQVHDWRSGRRTPRAEALADIQRATNGAVTAADFFPVGERAA